MIKGIIFDLDMCVFDTHSMGDSVIDPVFEVLDKSSLSLAVIDKVKNDIWTNSIQDVVEMNNLSRDFGKKLVKAYETLKVPDGSKAYDDVECLKDINLKKILVTIGFEKFQNGKIDKSGVRGYFDEIIISVINEREKRKSKKTIFKEIMQKYGWKPQEVLVVGDNPLSELKAGQDLGMVTVQSLRPGVIKWPGADHHVSSFYELGSLL